MKSNLFYCILIGILLHYFIYNTTYGNIVLSYIPNITVGGIITRDILIVAVIIFLSALFSVGPYTGLASGLILSVLLYELDYYIKAVQNIIRYLMASDTNGVTTVFSSVSDHILITVSTDQVFQVLLIISIIVSVIGGIISKRIFGEEK
ncbi:MAG: hypothetical protein ACP6IS_08720 [Candidatus Asgardarchaeia archaeon]